eukprot:g21367.t1
MRIDFDNLSDGEGKTEKDKLSAEDVMKEILELSQTELVVLSKSWDMFMAALGGERETVGDAIFGALSDRLICIKEAFKGRPRAIISLNLFNGFRLLCDKASNPQDRGRRNLGVQAFGQRDHSATRGWRHRSLFGVGAAERTSASSRLNQCVAKDADLHGILLQVYQCNLH